jgi:hypothetical protein
MKTESRRHAVTHLHARVEKCLVLLLAGRTFSEICKEAPISRSSLWRLRKSQEFQRRFNEAKADSFSAAVAALHAGAVTFVDTLKGVCLDDKARGSEKATAARNGLDSLFRAMEIFNLADRVKALEDAKAEDQK